MQASGTATHESAASRYGPGEHSSKAPARGQYETVDTAEFNRILQVSSPAGVVRKPVPRSGVENADGSRYAHEATSAHPGVSRVENSAPGGFQVENASGREISKTGSGIEETSLENQLLQFYTTEVRDLLAAEDFAAADEIIADVLANMTLDETSRLHWTLLRAKTLQMLGQWQASLELLSTVEDGEGYYRIAEAHYQLKNHTAAKVSCTNALRQLEVEAKQKRWPNSVTLLNMCIELMARITEAMGKKAESKFYRSKVVDGCVSPAHQRALRSSAEQPGQVQEATKEAKAATTQVVQIVRDLSRLNELLKPFNLRYEYTYGSDGRYGVRGSDDGYFKALEECLQGSTDRTKIDVDTQDYLVPYLIEEAVFREQKNYRTALYYAIFYDNPIATFLSIHLGSRLREIDFRQFGFSRPYPCHPLALASQLGSKFVAKSLLENGYDPNGDFCFNDVSYQAGIFKLPPPIFHAISANKWGIVKLLLDHGADPNIKYPWPLESPYVGEVLTPLHYAIRVAQTPHIAKLLLDNGADARAHTLIRGDTPIHIAANYGRTEILKMLLERDPAVDIANLKNKQDKSPFDSAEESDSLTAGLRSTVRTILNRSRIVY